MNSSTGVMPELTVEPVNMDERDVTPKLSKNFRGARLGGKGYSRSTLLDKLLKRDIYLKAPLRSDMDDPRKPAHLRKTGSVRSCDPGTMAETITPLLSR